MILTVTLNIALDRTVAVPRIALGNRHRVVDAAPGRRRQGRQHRPGAEGLGEPVIATGLAAGATGARIRELLDAEQVLHDFVEVAGDSRTNLAIVDPTSGEQTEINERGPRSPPPISSASPSGSLYLAGGADFCVIAGSLPPGSEADQYATLIAGLRARRRPDPARHRRRADAGRPAGAALRGRRPTSPRPRRRSATSSPSPGT